jgi:hypothetical protein
MWPNLNKLAPLLWKRKLLWRFYVAGNNKPLLSLHVKCPISCRILTKYGRARQIFVQDPNIKFHVKRPLEDALKHAERQADGHDESNRCFSRIYESACRGVPLTTHQFVAPSLKNEWNYTPSLTPGFHGLVQGEQKWSEGAYNRNIMTLK